VYFPNHNLQVEFATAKTLCQRLEFDFRLCDFRHTYGSRMALAGVDLMTLKELMGDSGITLARCFATRPQSTKFL
jgi:integrase